MLRYWLKSRSRHPSLLPAATVSVAVQATLLTAWVAVTMPAVGLPDDDLANKAIPVDARFLAPPDRARPGTGGETTEHVSYIGLALRAPGMGNDAPKPRPVVQPKIVVPLDELPVLPEVPRLKMPQDSVFTELDVDMPARALSSAIPDYPAELLKKNIEGRVVARWVIDTTGRADTASFELIQATSPEFAAAVKAVLPRMKFLPARIGTTVVKQLVEQAIAFKIQPPMRATPGPTKPTTNAAKPTI